MTQYLLSVHGPAEDTPEAWGFESEEQVQQAYAKTEALNAELQKAGVWVFGGGLESQRASVVATDGMVADGPYPETKEVIGGFAVVDVSSRDEALEWAAKIAAACRCAQEVRELLPDPPGLKQELAGARSASA